MYRDFERLRRDAEMLDDIRAYDAAKARKEERFPSDVVDRLLEGENPIRVFRHYRGMTQQQLAKVVQIARPYLAQLEKRKKQGSVLVLSAIANALRVDLADITG